MAENKKHSFVIYEDWMNLTLSLPDDDAIDFIRAVFSHCLDKEYTASPVSNALLQTVIPKLDADIDKYNTKRQKAKESVEKRWEKYRNGDTDVYDGIQTNTNVYERIPSNTNVIHDNVYDNVYDNDYVNDNDNDVLTDITKKEDAKASKKEVRHKYGQYENVLLSDTDMEKLKDEFPMDWQERIERLSEYIESKGAKYKNHLATIRAWARKNNDRKRPARSALGDILNDMPFDSSGDITGSKVWEVFNK